MALNFSSVFYLDKNKTKHTISAMYRYKKGEGKSKVWSSDGSGGVIATPDEYFTFTLLEDDTYSIAAADINNMPAGVVIPNTYNGKAVTKIADSGFMTDGTQIPPILSITLPDSITSIGENAFLACQYLKNVTLSKNLTSIGRAAFDNCAITTINLDECNQLTSIGDGAFSYGIDGAYITLPDSLTTIVSKAFSNCKIYGICIPASVTTVGADAFDLELAYAKAICCEVESKPDGWDADWTSIHSNYIYWDYTPTADDYFTFTEQEDGTYSVVAKDSTNMPNEVYVPLIYKGKGVTALGHKAFNYCHNITKIVLLESITSIGADAFQNCQALTEVNIPSGVTEIGDYTFFNCKALTSITIHYGITSIGELAFAHCTFAEILIPETVTTIGADAFFNCANLTIKCKATEKPSGWNDNWNSSDRPVTWGYTG